MFNTKNRKKSYLPHPKLVYLYSISQTPLVNKVVNTTDTSVAFKIEFRVMVQIFLPVVFQPC